ncbi:ATP phosphoribosyltransferase regulatory subunit [Liquorilactobacillus nagelii]|jgi:ATP phosphoribosyltransferase regulatory subunit|uniref:ATP phosphoribosyltransferase regulatory subunit n=1 Tax=Liquorilactobacillus nagelii TaxID=82688 RepID=UPI00242F917E|nr:ATP phosphoribosyltransferase regulatory subunit [Liquorilactobacillus nagelii]MCI1699865.1 ATP phosphoribosyltransferase regulatory subunit [Liquorilactobacillus nagelii]
MHKVNLPLGTRDEFGIRARRKTKVISLIEQELQARDYMKVSTPLLEYQEVFADFDLKQLRTYQLLDHNNETVVLRPDLTLPIARFLSANNLKLPQKFYYVGDHFKIAPLLSGRYNQLTQAGVEMVGYGSSKAECECLLLINRLSNCLHLNDIQVELGDARFVDAVLASITSNEKLSKKIKQALYQKNLPVYQQLIKRFEADSVMPFLKIWPRLFGSFTAVSQQLNKVELPTAAKQIFAETTQFASWAQRLPNQQIMLDLSTAPPQDYYTGLTFKVFMKNISDYLFSGGRYDQLLKNFQSQLEPAVGMGIDIDLLVDLETLITRNKKHDLLFFEPDQLATVAQIFQKYPELELSLADDLRHAQRNARNLQVKLYRLNAKGELEDVT